MSRSAARAVAATTTVDGALSSVAAHPTGRPLAPRLARRLAVATAAGTAERDAGMTTAEYAVGTVAACGFGGILYKVITSPEVLGLITDVIGRAFNLSF